MSPAPGYRSVVAALLCGLLAAGPVSAQDDDGVTVVPLDPPSDDPYEPLLDDEDGTYDDPFSGPLDDLGDDPFFLPDRDLSPETEERREEVESASGVVVRGLDKLTGRVADVSIATGETGEFGRMRISVEDCRYPVENPSGDAYAFLVVRDGSDDTPVFEGWMVASSPALNAMEHPRYDVWVLRCNT